MGVPKFFRYMSERYPCLSELIRADMIPEFDNLYLDMNGIIHNCSHPDDSDVHFRISEDQIFINIFKYIDKLFLLIQPQKLFFMAVDGVAPRAKMNQQRGRRFRSAKEGEVLQKRAESRGEVLPTEKRFDSNCITPGTEFMCRLQTALKYYVKSKISTNKYWQRCRVILSGHETPGEGEHKIMEYIRYMKAQPNYDKNTRHCLYGLDADLMILGLCTHEIHFSLLREEVLFGRSAKKFEFLDTRFFLLHLGLFREYLELDFYNLLKVEEHKKRFDIDNIIDDWVLMGFFLGNDFIPHLPHFHIHSNGFPLLYKTYMNVYPELGGNINENGKLNLKRLEILFRELSQIDKQMFDETNADLKYMNAQTFDADFLSEDEVFDTEVMDSQLAELIQNSKNDVSYYDFMHGDNNDIDSLDLEFAAHKRNYYMEKMKYKKVTSDTLKEQTICYIEALQWILFYYYRGVCSWEWFYPHHYAPYISDVRNFKNYKINFNLGTPFHPFEQLLAVLPAASKDLLPEALRDLMTSKESMVIDYYPLDFETDLNGKKQEWEAVVLIPFIDEDRLLAAMKPCLANLTPEEVERNKHGPMLQYDFNKNVQKVTVNIGKSFPVLKEIYCNEIGIWRDEIIVKISDNPERKITATTKLHPKMPCHVGFPSLKYLKHTAEFRKNKVKVFDQNSRNESLILLPELKIPQINVEVAAKKYLNRIVWIGWPHLMKVKIIAVSDPSNKLYADGYSNFEIGSHIVRVSSVNTHCSVRMGIDFQEINVLVYGLPVRGLTYTYDSSGYMRPKYLLDQACVAYPVQGVVSHIAVHETEGSMERKELEDIFPEQSTVFVLEKSLFGREGKVLRVFKQSKRLKVQVSVKDEPNYDMARTIQDKDQNNYFSTYEAAYELNMEPNVLSRITGTLLISSDSKPSHNNTDNYSKTNIGLQLKFPKQNEELIGYTKKINRNYYFSTKAIDLVNEYRTKFPEVYRMLSSNWRREQFFETDLINNRKESQILIKNITAWLKTKDLNNTPRVYNGTKIVEKATLIAILTELERVKNILQYNTVKIDVKPHLLLPANSNIPEAFQTKDDLELFDRVVIVRDQYNAPLGTRGTIVGIYPSMDSNPVRIECAQKVEILYDILTDKQLLEGNSLYGLANNHIVRVSAASFLVVSSRKSTISNSNQNQLKKSVNLENKDITEREKFVNNSKNITTEKKGMQISKMAENQSQSTVTRKEKLPKEVVPIKKQPTPINIVQKQFTNSEISKITKISNDEKSFSQETRVLLLNKLYMGCEGKIVNSLVPTNSETQLCKVRIFIKEEPQLIDAKNVQNKLGIFYPINQAALLCGLSTDIFCRITSALHVVPSEQQYLRLNQMTHINIAIPMVYPEQDSELCGYAQKSGNGYLFSQQAIDLVKQYKEAFPYLFDSLAKLTYRQYYFEFEILNNDKYRLSNITSWLAARDYRNAMKVKNGTISISKSALISLILAVDEVKDAPLKTIEVDVPSNELLRFEETLPSEDLCMRPLAIFDRVVVKIGNAKVNAGTRGTVINIYPALPNGKIVCDMLLDEIVPALNGELYGIAKNRIFKVLNTSLLHIQSQPDSATNSSILQEELSSTYMQSAEGGRLVQSPQSAFRRVNGIGTTPKKQIKVTAETQKISNVPKIAMNLSNIKQENVNTNNEKVVNHNLQYCTDNLKILLGLGSIDDSRSQNASQNLSTMQTNISMQPISPSSLPMPPRRWQLEASINSNINYYNARFFNPTTPPILPTVAANLNINQPHNFNNFNMPPMHTDNNFYRFNNVNSGGYSKWNYPKNNKQNCQNSQTQHYQ